MTKIAFPMPAVRLFFENDPSVWNVNPSVVTRLRLFTHQSVCIGLFTKEYLLDCSPTTVCMGMFTHNSVYGNVHPPEWMCGTVHTPEWTYVAVSSPEWMCGTAHTPEWTCVGVHPSEWMCGTVLPPEWMRGTVHTPEWTCVAVHPPEWMCGTVLPPVWMCRTVHPPEWMCRDTIPSSLDILILVLSHLLVRCMYRVQEDYYFIILMYMKRFLLF